MEQLRHATRGEALAFLRDCRPGGGEPRCPRCAGLRLYFLKDGRFRCPGCGYTFAEFAGTWLGRAKLPPESWVALLRAFEQGQSVEEAAVLLGIAYATAFKACHLIRAAILAASPDGMALLDAGGEVTTFCPNMDDEPRQGSCPQCRSPVFGVRRAPGEGDGRVEVRLLPRAMARDVFGFPLPLKPWRGFVYTGPFRGQESLVFSCCRAARQTYADRFVDEPLPLDRPGGFREFAEAWLARYRCPAPQTAALYLHELELRYNHRGRPLLPILAGQVLRPVAGQCQNLETGKSLPPSPPCG